MSVQASPFSRLASATVSGLVSTLAQTWAGVKTFTGAIIASAGVQLASLWNTNGTGATDVCVKVGTSTADGSVNAGAKLLSVRTGVGGTEVEKAFIDKSGGLSAGGQISTSSASGAGGFAFGSTAVLWETGSTLVLRARGSAANYNSTTPAIWLIPFGAVDPDDLIISVATSGGTHLATVNGAGRFDQSGTDSSGTPGAATINKPTGKSAIAIGASSVVITNSLVTAAMRVMITPHARDTTCKELIAVAAAGSFTVSGTANATAALPFSWEVSNII